ncbi:MAG: hypothetical protein FWC00_04595 [Firmicutes bacterium]|nr:hypothetical protein [Bacillota bacterium]
MKYFAALIAIMCCAIVFAGVARTSADNNTVYASFAAGSGNASGASVSVASTQVAVGATSPIITFNAGAHHRVSNLQINGTTINVTYMSDAATFQNFPSGPFEFRVWFTGTTQQTLQIQFRFSDDGDIPLQNVSVVAATALRTITIDAGFAAGSGTAPNATISAATTQVNAGATSPIININAGRHHRVSNLQINGTTINVTHTSQNPVIFQNFIISDILLFEIRTWATGGAQQMVHLQFRFTTPSAAPPSNITINATTQLTSVAIAASFTSGSENITGATISHASSQVNAGYTSPIIRFTAGEEHRIQMNQIRINNTPIQVHDMFESSAVFRNFTDVNNNFLFEFRVWFTTATRQVMEIQLRFTNNNALPPQNIAITVGTQLMTVITTINASFADGSGNARDAVISYTAPGGGQQDNRSVQTQVLADGTSPIIRFHAGTQHRIDGFFHINNVPIAVGHATATAPFQYFTDENGILLFEFRAWVSGLDSRNLDIEFRFNRDYATVPSSLSVVVRTVFSSALDHNSDNEGGGNVDSLFLWVGIGAGVIIATLIVIYIITRIKNRNEFM